MKRQFARLLDASWEKDMTMRITYTVILALMIWGLAGCLYPNNPDVPISNPRPPEGGSLRIAALDYQVGDLTNPTELAKYTRADVLIVQGRFPEAEAALLELLELEPGFAPAEARLAALRSGQ